MTAPLADSDPHAEEIAASVAEEIKQLGGSITVGRNFGDAPAILIVQLPDDLTVTPDQLIEGISFKEVHAFQVPAVEDHGITE